MLIAIDQLTKVNLQLLRRQLMRPAIEMTAHPVVSPEFCAEHSREYVLNGVQIKFDKICGISRSSFVSLRDFELTVAGGRFIT